MLHLNSQQDLTPHLFHIIEDGPGISNQNLIPGITPIPLAKEMFEKPRIINTITERYSCSINTLEILSELIHSDSVVDYLQERKRGVLTEYLSPKEKRSKIKLIESLLNTDIDKDLLQKEVNYLLENLPSLNDYSNFIKLAVASGITLANGSLANGTKYAATGYFAYKTFEETDPTLKSIYGFIASYSAITSVSALIPSFASISRYLMFTLLEETAFKTFKFLNNGNNREDLKFRKRDFTSNPRLALLMEGTGILVLLPLEIFRIFELEEVSLGTIKLWGKFNRIV